MLATRGYAIEAMQSRLCSRGYAIEALQSRLLSNSKVFWLLGPSFFLCAYEMNECMHECMNGTMDECMTWAGE